jgi:HAD superfamily hydrolase (TIGR01509 family)
MEARFGLVIFDCDGVLVDSEPLVNRVFLGMLAELGYELDEAESLRELSGCSMAARLAVVGARLGWSPPPGFEAEFHRRLAARVGRELEAVEGVREALAQLTAPTCVASNGSLEEIRMRLAAVGLLERFEAHLFSAIEVRRAKPAPDVYLHAAKAMGVEPARCAVVEDSVPGVRAAVAAGMAVFGYARLTAEAALREAGACTFHRMAELPALLGEPLPAE